MNAGGKTITTGQLRCTIGQIIVPDIVLATLNARYPHASFGLRYLMANLGALRDRARMMEFEIKRSPAEIAQTILAAEPRIVGIGVYIWNAAQATQLVRELKQLKPKTIIVLGGPEVSYETDQQEIVRLADYVITGEADLAFAILAEKILVGQAPFTRVIAAELPQFSQLALPYDLYDDEDIAHRVIYVEASRGCPFTCEFCLSSLDIPVRNAPLEGFLEQMARLLDRGVRQFKFVDRTFNLNLNISRAILDFFLTRYRPGLFLHFEMIPDRLPEALRVLIRSFPPGALQFEVGIQTFNEEVSQRISRRQDNAKLGDNVRFLREETGVHVHADLIVGLPGEDIASFAAGFDRLVALGPQEIQVGMLKRLRGTPIVRHDAQWVMRYNTTAPYEIIENGTIDAQTMARLRRFARVWDLIANSGNFVRSTPLIWRDSSPFWSFLRFSDWLFESLGKMHGIPLMALAEAVFGYLNDQTPARHLQAAEAVAEDYCQGGRRRMPAFLKPLVSPPAQMCAPRPIAPRRQVRHLNLRTSQI